MSAILGVFAVDCGLTDDAIVQQMLRQMHGRGGDRADAWRGEGASLAVSRSDWELDPGFSGPALVVKEGDVVVTADASLYYRADLIRKLHGCGIHATGGTPSHLILAAYRAWGERCAEHLEGDFAFILWDAASRTVLCARDFGGKRSLYYAEAVGTLIAASTIGGVVAHPSCSTEFNLAEIAACASGLFASPEETCYRDVRSLPAGFTLVRSGGAMRVARHWEPPRIEASRATPFEAAAEELRELLCRAVSERLDPNRPTSVWLSGGRDSTSIFGAGEKVLRDRGEGEDLRAVSISYPPGDPGREDEWIEAVAAHWGTPVHWVDIAGIPFLDRPRERAMARDEPFAHAFEMMNRTLARRSCEAGARVVLDGKGGDQLFQVSDIYLADLFRTGRWLNLAREWRSGARRGSGFRSFFVSTLQPTLPEPILELAEILRGGRPLRRPLDRPAPDWIDRDFVRRHDLTGRERTNTPRRREKSYAAGEMYWYLTTAYGPRITSSIHAFTIEHGIETRSPLYDSRIIAFAAARPRDERRSGTDSKRLLRRSMRGLLPDHVLAPRRYRTGVTHKYFADGMRKVHAEFIERTFAAPLAVADLGIVCADILRKRWDEYRRENNDVAGLSLFLTLQTELWLRARLGEGNHRTEDLPDVASVARV